MKLACATLLLALGSASAFTAPSANGPATALRATTTETYTFTKSEEIFAEAQTVSFPTQPPGWLQSHASAAVGVGRFRLIHNDL